MSKFSKIFLIVGSLFVVFIVIPFASVIGLWYSDSVFGNRYETQIHTMYMDGKNIHGQFIGKMMDLANVRKMSIADQTSIIQAVFGKGGRAGNQAAWQWVKEQNPKADLTVHNKMVDIIDSMRNKFMHHQTSLLAVCQVYQERLGHPIHSVFLSFSGYPNKRLSEYKLTIEKMCTPISSTQTNQAFDAGVDDGVKF
jgi:hypothetical protein